MALDAPTIRPLFEAAIYRELLGGLPAAFHDDAVLDDTPARAARAWRELTAGYFADPELTTFDANGYDEIVAVARIPFYSLCEHHLLPFHGHANIPYLPNGRILGLSKFARLVDVYARRLQTQERLTAQVADRLDAELGPRGMAVVMEAEHLCMTMRGVQRPGAVTRTSVMRGVFRDKPAARAEALDLLGDGMNRGDALVLFSGSKDSTTCLLWALSNAHDFGRVHAVSFDYGQRHKVELEQAGSILAALRGRGSRLGEWITLGIPALSELAGAALTSSRIEVEAEASQGGGNLYAAERGLPSTFVPGRNTILIGTAAALAGKLNAPHVVTGICAMDRAGYPDCRAEYASALETTLRLGLDSPRLTLHTPLLFASKSETWRLAEEVAGAQGVELVRELSHTCYLGIRDIDHAWGYGCGEYPTCETRAVGWRAYAGTERVPA